MKNLPKSLSLLAVPLLAALSAACLNAQMVSPSIDRPGQPFSYFSAPTDEIGVMDAEAATEITPEGYLRTGFGELMFFAGPELKPTSVRIRTLEEGRLPIVHYDFERNGVVYRFTLFAATQSIQNGEPKGPLVNFIRIEMKNQGSEPNRAILATGIRYDAPNKTGAPHGDNRFDRPREGKFPGDYRQLGETFSPDWVYSFSPDGFLRDGRLFYTFPAGYSARGFTLHGRYNYPQDISKPSKLDVDPVVPVGIVTYSRLLQPGEESVLDFKMPVVPTADPAALAALAQASFDGAKAQIVAFWNQILSQGMQIGLPEQKPVDTFYTNLIYDLIARDHIGPDYIQTVNKLHYHSFYLRDGADIVHSYDVTGYPEVAKQDLQFFARSQKPDGNFLSQEQQYDGWGEAVWGYSQHYRITHDKAFAEWALPQIARAEDWLRRPGPPIRCTSCRPATYATTNTSPATLPAITSWPSPGSAWPSRWPMKPATPTWPRAGRPNTTATARLSSRCSTNAPAPMTATFLPHSTGRRAATTGATCSPWFPSPHSPPTIPA